MLLKKTTNHKVANTLALLRVKLRQQAKGVKGLTVPTFLRNRHEGAKVIHY